MSRIGEWVNDDDERGWRTRTGEWATPGDKGVADPTRYPSLESFCQELEEARKQFDTTLLGDAAKTIRELCQVIDYQQKLIREKE
jgi:hypothetical protein